MGCRRDVSAQIAISILSPVTTLNPASRPNLAHPYLYRHRLSPSQSAIGVIVVIVVFVVVVVVVPRPELWDRGAKAKQIIALVFWKRPRCTPILGLVSAARSRPPPAEGVRTCAHHRRRRRPCLEKQGNARATTDSMVRQAPQPSQVR